MEESLRRNWERRGRRNKLSGGNPFFFFFFERPTMDKGVEEVGRFVSASPFSWLRSLTLHAAGDVGSLTSPTLLSRGLRKVWGGGRGGGGEGNGSETGSGGRGTGHRRGLTARRGVALTYLCRVLRATPIQRGRLEPTPSLRFLCQWVGMSTLCALSHRDACLPACRC